MKYIESVKNPQVKQWKKLLTKKEREKTHTYLLEGFHLVEEALQYKDEILEIIISEEVEFPSNWNVDNLPITRVTTEISRSISDTETTQGIFAICKIRKAVMNELTGKAYLMLDGVQDPGNLGTMIRTADAAGIDAVILGMGTADLYNPKVLRSAQGSHFHLSFLSGRLDEWIIKLKEANVPVYGTALENGIPYKEVEPASSFGLILGNEGNGVSKEVLALTDKNLYIPIFGKSESLNVAVAAGILMYYFKN
ncbi:RNA methyltransferase [Bacillus sp. FJAT-49736]|uniref:TrmH family RNA methyltransferase n=1 Tax=Bacillus sp. FJAT-49736 TaxID=2833582 RepID=UPI001BCA3BEB|nr:RNA methyltransferase [Bacillus sp. FJAT-49736]